MNKLKILNNWIVKAIIITVVPFIISIIDNYGDWKTSEGEWINVFDNGKIWVILLSVLYILFVIIIAFIERKESQNKIEIKALEEEIDQHILEKEVYQEVFKSLNTLINDSQKNINDLSKKILKTDNLELLNWNFESVANCICRDVLEILKKIAVNGDDITVNIYIRHKEDKKRSHEYIKMVAHAGKPNSEPKILYTDIPLSRKKDWQYAKLFLNSDPKVVVYATEEEILNNFKFHSSPQKHAGEYSQYIGIPISCASGNIISSMEIIAHNDTIIANSEKEILEIINKYIFVYRNYALLTHKIEKGLRAKRVVNEKGER